MGSDMRRNLRAGGDIKKKADSRQQTAGRARGFRVQELPTAGDRKQGRAPRAKVTTGP
jgi:hypothetical protein